MHPEVGTLGDSDGLSVVDECGGSVLTLYDECAVSLELCADLVYLCCVRPIPNIDSSSLPRLLPPGHNSTRSMHTPPPWSARSSPSSPHHRPPSRFFDLAQLLPRWRANRMGRRGGGGVS